MNRLIVAVGLMLAVASSGCATGNTVAAGDWPTRYAKAGVASDQLTKDGLDCHWDAKGERVDGATAFFVGGWIGLAVGVPTAETHAACMRAKGYTVNSSSQ